MKYYSSRKRYYSHIVALALYTLLALALTWPLAAHLATRAIGSAVWAFDEYTFLWNLWWFKFSALNLGQTPLHTDYIFYPLGIDLVSYTLNLFNGMLGLPLQLALPLPLASNLVILFTYIMGGYGGYLLACYLLAAEARTRANALGSRLPLQAAAFIAGAVYAFTAARMVYAALGHYNVLTAQWFPFYALFLLKTWREPGLRNPILAGIWTTFILLAEPFFGVFWLFLTVLLSLFEILRSAQNDGIRHPERSEGSPPLQAEILRPAQNDGIRHPERSEGSPPLQAEILRSAQNDGIRHPERGEGSPPLQAEILRSAQNDGIRHPERGEGSPPLQAEILRPAQNDGIRHPERSEGSPPLQTEILRPAQNDGIRHPERSEGSPPLQAEILHSAQNDGIRHPECSEGSPPLQAEILRSAQNDGIRHPECSEGSPPLQAEILRPAQNDRNIPLSTTGLRRANPLLRLVVMGLTAGILWSPVLAAMARAFTQGDFELSGWGHGARLSADVVGWFTPTALHPVFGVAEWPAYLRAVVEGKTMFQDVNTVFLGYGILLLAAIGALSAWKRVKVWVWGAVVFAIFTLGPLLQIKGQFLFSLDNLLREQGIPQDVTFPLPFALLHYIPFLKANRVPNRFSVILSLALAVLVGYGAFVLLRKLPGRHQASRRRMVWGAGVLLLAVALFDQLAVPLPLTDARIPAPYEAIAAETDDFTIMTIPFGWRDSFGTKGSERTQVQYYQAYHHKRLVTGNTSRASQFKFDYYLRIPLFRALTAVELYNSVDEETLARAREQAGELMTLYDVRYLVVHDPVPLRYPEVDTTEDALALAHDLMPISVEPEGSGDGVSVYRVIQPPVPDPLRIDFGQWRAEPYRGEGWEADEDIFAATANWVLGTEAQVFFPVRGGGSRHLSMQIAPFAYPGATTQTMELELNGRLLDEAFTLVEGWQVVEAILPEQALRPGLNVMTLHFAHATPPASVLDGVSDTRPLAAAVDWLALSN